MSLLNIWADGLPNVLAVLHSTLVRQGQAGMTKEGLLDQVAPPALVEDKGEMAKKTLRSWIDVGLIQDVEGQLKAESLPRTTRTADPLELLAFTRRAACRCALAPTANANLWKSDGAGDLTRALAWMLMQDAYRHGFEHFAALEEEQLINDQVEIIRNASRLAGLKDWAPFLGFSRGAFAAIDPTVALRDALPEIMEEGRTMNAQEFLQAVARVLPVLDYGHWQGQVREKLRAQPAFTLQPGLVSTALSRAIWNLRATEELMLRKRSDTGLFLKLSGAQGPREDLVFHEVERPKKRT